MDYRTFSRVIEHIETGIEGDAYTLHIRTKTGDTIRDCAWEALSGTGRYTGEFTTIILSCADRPPIYLLIEQIESVELAS